MLVSRAKRIIGVPVIRTRHQSYFSNKANNFHRRDILIEDFSLSKESWNDSWNQLVHPSSKHIVANYHTNLFNSRPYTLHGEDFLLHISPVLEVSRCNSSAPREGHQVLIWPDKIVIENATSSDVKTIVDFASKSTLIDPSELRDRLGSSNCFVQSKIFPDLIIISASSPSVSMPIAEQVLEWFKIELDERNVSKSHGARWLSDSRLFLSAVGDSRGPHVTALGPFEESIELVDSKKKVSQLVLKYTTASAEKK